MARWEDALDALTDIYKFWRSDTGKLYAKGFLSDREQKIASGAYHGDDLLALRAAPDPSYDKYVGDLAPDAQITAWRNKRNEMVEIYRDMDSRLGAMAFNSDPIYVDPDVWTLVEGAAEQWQGEPLHASDLPTAAGFMLLPRPVYFHDVWQKRVAIRAVNWHPMQFQFRDPETGKIGGLRSGILIALYHHASDRDDYTQPGEGTFGQWLLVHAQPWFFGVDEGGPRVEGFHVAMYLQVCWRLMQQDVIVGDQRKPGGQFAKRAERADIDKRVTVVTLRRARQDQDDREPRTVDWAKRWVVSGHWRNQWYAVAQIHRLIWIAPFVKGPEDKPLVINKVRAFQFVR